MRPISPIHPVARLNASHGSLPEGAETVDTFGGPALPRVASAPHQALVGPAQSQSSDASPGPTVVPDFDESDDEDFGFQMSRVDPKLRRALQECDDGQLLIDFLADEANGAALSTLPLLEIGSMLVTDEEREPLCALIAERCPRLQVLALSAFTLDGPSAAHLVTLPQLHSLFMTECEVDAAAFKQLFAIEQLWHLVLEETPVDPSALPLLTGLKALRLLDLPGIGVDDLQYLMGMSELAGLILHDCDLGSTGTRSLAALTGLTSLTLSGCPVAPDSVAALSSLTALERLSWSGSPGLADGLEHCAKDLGALCKIDIQDDTPGLPLFRCLSKLEALEEVNVIGPFEGRCSVPDEAAPLLGRLGKLRSLKAMYVSFSDACVAALLDLPGLQKLKVDHTLLSEDMRHRVLAEKGVAALQYDYVNDPTGPEKARCDRAWLIEQGLIAKDEYFPQSSRGAGDDAFPDFEEESSTEEAPILFGD